MLDQSALDAVNRGEAVVAFALRHDHDGPGWLAQLREQLPPGAQYLRLDVGAPQESVRINPLRHYARATELGCRIASLAAYDADDIAFDPFTAFAAMVLSNIIKGMELVGETATLTAIDTHVGDGARTLVARALEAWLRSHASAQADSGRVDALIHAYSGCGASHPTIDGLLGVFEHDREHLNKMLALLRPVLQALTEGAMGPLLSPDPADTTGDVREVADLDRLIDWGGVLFVDMGPLPGHSVGSMVAALILADLTALMNQRAREHRPSTTVNLVFDGPAETAKWHEAFERARQAGVRMDLAA